MRSAISEWGSAALADALDVVRRARSRPTFVWAVAAPIATLFVALATNAIASRALGPARFGTYVVATVASTLLGIAISAGMPATLVRYASGLPSEGERAAVIVLAWRIMMLAGIAVAAGFLLSLVVAPTVLRAWIPEGTGVAILAAGIGATLVEMAAAERQAAMHFFGYFFTNTGLAVSRLVGVLVAFGLLGQTVTSALTGYGAGSLAAGAVLASFAHRRGRRVGEMNSPTAGLTRSLLTFGLPILGSAYVVAIITYLDTLVVAKVLTSNEVGLYAAGSRLTLVHHMLIAGITTVALPVAARAIAAGQASRFVRQALGAGLLIGSVLCGVFVLGAGLLVRLVYGPAYELSATVFAILTMGFTLNFAGNPLSQLLYASGRSRFMLGVHLTQLAVLFLAIPAAAARGGAVAVATVWALVNLSAVIAVILRVRGVRLIVPTESTA